MIQRAVAKGVLIASILSVLGVGIAMYVDYQKAKGTGQTTPVAERLR